jgi:hypothetical protein
MPPKQVRLDRMWVIRGRATPDDGQVAIAAAAKEVDISACRKEVDMEQDATHIGGQFVSNGNRDRFGQQRQNVGGRPKKVNPADGLGLSSNRRVAGKPRRKEFGASEKLQMILKAKNIETKVRSEHVGISEGILVKVVQQAIGKHLPTLATHKKFKNLMAQEEKLQHLVHENRLGVDLSNPQKKNRGSQCGNRHGNHRGAGFRSSGAGRKNKYVKFWQLVKMWHTCERLTGVRVDTQDIYLKFHDNVSLEIKFLQYWESAGQLPVPQQVWLKELQHRLNILAENQKYREVYIDRLMAWGSMRVGRPSRTTSMTIEEEKVGWKITMKSWDQAVFLAGLGTAADLKGVVALPEEFVKRRKDIALVFGDQAPKTC